MRIRILILVLLAGFAAELIPTEANAQLGGRLRNAGQQLGSDLQEAGEGVADDLAPPEVTDEALRPSMVHDIYAALDEEEEFANGVDGITYKVTGVETYDAFFMEVARLRGTVRLAQHTVAQVESMVNGEISDSIATGELFTNSIGETVEVASDARPAFITALVTGNFAAAQATGTSITQEQFDTVRTAAMEQWSDISALQEQIPIAVTALIELPQQASALASQSTTLVTDAPAAFAGPQALNVPQVVEGLEEASGHLQELPSESAAVGQALGGFVGQ